MPPVMMMKVIGRATSPTSVSEPALVEQVVDGEEALGWCRPGRRSASARMSGEHGLLAEPEAGSAGAAGIGGGAISASPAGGGATGRRAR